MRNPDLRLFVHAAKPHLPLARAIVERIRKAGIEASIASERKIPFADCVLEVRDLATPPAGLGDIQSALRPLEHLLVGSLVGALVGARECQPHEAHFWIAGSAGAFRRRVVVHCAAPVAGNAVRDALRKIGFRNVEVEASSSLSADEIIYQSAPLLARDAAGFVLHGVGAPPVEIETTGEDGLDDGSLRINLFTPAIRYLARSLIVETDDPAALPACVAEFRRAGFRDVKGRVVEHGVIERATIDPGALDAAGEEGIIARLMVAAGAAMPDGANTGYPVQRVAPDSATPLVRLPVQAVRSGTLRPYAGAAPSRWHVRIETDDRAMGLVMVADLKARGFKSIEKKRINDRVDSGFEIRAGAGSHCSPALIEEIREMLEGIMLKAPGTASMPIHHIRTTEDFIEVFAPFDAARKGLLSDELDDPGRFSATIRAAEPEAEIARAALMDLGFRRIHVEDGSPEIDLIEFGAASNEFIATVRRMLAKRLGPPMPTPDRRWRSGQAKIRISLTDRSAFHMPTDKKTRDSARKKPSPAAAKAAREDTTLADGIVPHKTAEGARPFIELSWDEVRIGRECLRRRTNGGARPPRCPEAFTIDPKTAAILEHLAQSYALGEAVLLEGETGTSKTASVMYLAHLLGSPFDRLNLSSQIDVQDFVGRYDPSRGRWRWKDGRLPAAMKLGAILLLDEINLAASGVVERLNSVLERPSFLGVSEHLGEQVEAAPGFFLAATCNPMSYEGRQELSPALSGRFTGLRVDRPDAADHTAFLRRCVLGQTPSIRVGGITYAGETVAPIYPALGELTGVAKLLDRLGRFHAEVEAAAIAAGEGGSGMRWSGTTSPAFSRRQLIDTLKFLDRYVSRGETLMAVTDRAVARYYCGRLSGDAAEVVRDLAAANDLLRRRGQ